MGITTDNFFENNLFRFDNTHCICNIDKIYFSPTQAPQTTIKVHALPGKPIHFAFAPSVGLVRLGEKGTLVEKNLLGSLISIKNKDTNSLFDFFKRNGFLFKISDTEYEPIDTEQMFELIKRLRCTVELLSALGSIKKDYQKILGLSLYLILSKPIEINFSSLHTPYRTCMHTFFDRILKAYDLPQPSQFNQCMFQGNYIPIKDTLSPPVYNLDFQIYASCLEGSGQEYWLKGSSNDLFKSVVLLYAHGENETIKTRRAVDLLFHYFYEVGIIKDIEEDGKLLYYDQVNSGKITSVMKSRIIELAHEVIAEEINANMNSIHPLYDAEKMMPSWHVDTLLGGLYFSIFYMKPDLELFRRCRHCGQFFSVKATSTRKVYCSDSCRNSYQQSMHRKRKREKEEND